MSGREARRAGEQAAEAGRRAVDLEQALQGAVRALREAEDSLRATLSPLQPDAEQVRRIEEVARDSGEAMTRTDLLALNFQVEAARLGEDDRHLHRVAHEIRSLADRGARGAREIGQLAAALRGDLHSLAEVWSGGLTRLGEAGEQLERAARATEGAVEALATVREAAGVVAAAEESRVRDADEEAAVGLAAAAQVRGDALHRLGVALGARLRSLAAMLGREAEEAEGALGLIEGELAKDGALDDLAGGADEIARRARQLAINADLAATRSDDPGFGLFAEEARRLSEQAEATAEAAHRRATHQARRPARALARGLGSGLREVAAELNALAGRFGGEAAEAAADALGQAWREDRSAADALAQALAEWNRPPRV